jgi:hypothetical protein
MRRAQSIAGAVDVDTLAHIGRSLNDIIGAAGALKQARIQKMNAEKAAARAGRQ